MQKRPFYMRSQVCLQPHFYLEHYEVVFALHDAP
jgi:hypothetical protein